MSVKNYNLSRITPTKGLGKREMQVFRLFGKGFDSRSIASQLGISHRTVHSHRYHIKTKLGLASVIEFYQLAYRYASECEQMNKGITEHLAQKKGSE